MRHPRRRRQQLQGFRSLGVDGKPHEVEGHVGCRNAFHHCVLTLSGPTSCTHRRAKVLTIFLLCALVGVALSKFFTLPIAGPQRGQRGPSFELADVAGQLHSTHTWQGRRVLLVFWAPWTELAIQQVRALQTLHATRDVVLVDVALDYVAIDEVRNVISSIRKEANASFPSESLHLLGRSERLGAWNRLPLLPLVCLVDENDTVVFLKAGYVDPQQLQSLIDGKVP